MGWGVGGGMGLGMGLPAIAMPRIVRFVGVVVVKVIVDLLIVGEEAGVARRRGGGRAAGRDGGREGCSERWAEGTLVLIKYPAYLAREVR